MQPTNFVQNGQAVRKVVASDLQTPVCPLKQSSLVMGYTYPNSSQVRYQAALSIDPDLCAEFLDLLEEYRKSNAVDEFLQPVFSHAENGDVIPSGLFLMRFSAKLPPKIYEMKDGKEVQKKFKEEILNIPCKITFDIVKYLEKQSGQFRFTFPIKKIIIYKEQDES